jgi:hypothetical protein
MANVHILLIAHIDMLLAIIIIVGFLGFSVGTITSTRSRTKGSWNQVDLQKWFLRLITPWQLRSAFPDTVSEESVVNLEGDKGDALLLTK